MPGGQRPALEFRDLSYVYPGSGHPVLDSVNLTLYRGEFVSVIGPNGSGKSTLARLAAGLILPVKGYVLVDGLDTRNRAIGQEIRRRVGLVMQNPDNQIIASVIEEDVAFGPENLNLPPGEIRRRVDQTLKSVGLTHLRGRPPHLLSGGEKQRLAIAGLLALEPSVLVLDEPTSMLDPRGRIEVLGLLKRLSTMGTVVVLITHYMDEAAQSQRVLLLGNGGLVAEGSPNEIFSQIKLLREMGLETTNAAVLAGKLADRGIPVPGGIITIEEMVGFLCHVLK